MIQLLTLEWGPLKKDWELLYVSDGVVTQVDYDNYIHVMHEYEKHIMTSKACF